ncbi:Tox-REase-5 domain-containing protein [Archangium violaceum]|uniref:Tox-REase-5 domain-containing protein n=1 Tax=Archangium violaceum TaxID=83451 RepID=UPI002B2B0237|nr:Tox-REase-5 domain-containing protein [Archangium gephyra]
MLAEWTRKWVALVWGAVVLSTGCVTVMPPSGHGTFRHRGELVRGTELAMVSPAGMAVRTVASGAMQSDAFEYLLLLAGLDNVNDEPPRGAPLTPQEAARVLAVLLTKPVTLGSFPPRMAVCHLLREVLEGGEVSREELLHRVERFRRVAVLRPDGYLAWTLDGRTQQKVGPVEWKEEAFRAGPFELGHFYTVSGWVFGQADAQLRPIPHGPGLAEVYDDADSINRSLEGAQEAFVELYHAMGQLLSHPSDSIAALKHLPAGVAALIASSPQYLERFRYMTRGERVKAVSKLLTHLLVTFGTAGGTTSTLTRAMGGLEATVPVLSLSADGLLVVERVVVPVGKVATVLSSGPGAAIILQRANASGESPSPAAGPGQWGPARESMSGRARAYQEQISGHSADEAYWVGGTSAKDGGVRFDGFKDGVLLEAKGPGYANKFFDTLEPRPWFKHSGAKALVDQAKRQLEAARITGTPIRWHVAEEKTADAIRRLFKLENVAGIEVVYTPAL